MSKKILIIFIAIIIISSGIYLYMRYHVLKAPDIATEPSKKETILDLRPQLIAKLQQLVKEGSVGLYKLTVDQVTPDVLASTAEIKNVSIDVDSAMLKNLDEAGKLPDDIFKMKFSAIHISGLGIADFIDKKNLSINKISIDKPVIEVFHQSRAYNKNKRAAKENLTLYQKLSGHFTSLEIEKILLSNGKFTHHNRDKKEVVSKLENVNIQLDKILVDSSTQYDASRYLFAKFSKLEAENYHVITPDNMYSFSVGKIAVSGERRHLKANNIVFEPNGGRAAFIKKLKDRKMVFDIHIPTFEMDGIDWWALLNRDQWAGDKGYIKDATFGVYADRRLPAPVLKQNNFPHQLVMRLPMLIDIKNLFIERSKVVYEEYNPQVDKTVTVTINRLNGTIDNITNVKSTIAQNPWTKVNAKALFMNKVPLSIGVNLNLAKVSTGDFTADILVDTLNNELINPISELSSLFSVKRGQIQSGKAHMSGDNSIAKGNIILYYNDLHVTPLKTIKKDNGKQKSKHATSLVANILFIKNSNPLKGSLRQPSFIEHRDPYTGFVKLIWTSIRAGIVKTVGIPLKIIDKNAE
ncbi:MAG: hypothetical protein ABIY51_01710 [Ferruginibacter sp.]